MASHAPSGSALRACKYLVSYPPLFRTASGRGTGADQFRSSKGLILEGRSAVSYKLQETDIPVSAPDQPPQTQQGNETQPDSGGRLPSVNLSGSATAVSISASTVEYSAYGFLELRSLSSLDKWDISYLASKGCFTLPGQSILDEFVKKYFLHIHMSTPILDEAEFWQLYSQQRNRASSHGRSLSVLVLQAMLFRSCPLLLDLKAEDRPLERAQGALLLSYQASPDDPQIGSLLLANAIQNAIILGKPPKPSVSFKESTIKRLWWSILLRDRWISLALRRRSQLTTKDFDAENSALEEADFIEEIQESKVYDVQTKRIVFKVLQQQCRLAIVLTDMTSLIFSSCDSSAMGLPSKEFPACMGNVLKTRNRLRQWETEWRYTLSSTPSDVRHSVTSFIKMTYVYYYTAHIHLAHYEALLLEANLMFIGHSYTMQLQEIGGCLQEAVKELHDVLKYFSNTRDIEAIPLCILAFVGWPLVVAAIDAGLAPNDAEAVQRQRELNVLGSIYHALVELYDVTKFVAVGTKEILHLVTKMAEELGIRRRQPARASEVQKPYQRGAAFPNTTWKALEEDKHASGWFDLFIRYPRIYLLIAASTDYSLSSGRLPHENALPEVLRSVASGFLGFQLPWVTKASLDETEQKAQKMCDRHRKNNAVDFIGPRAQPGPRTASEPGRQMYAWQHAPQPLSPPYQVARTGQDVTGNRDDPAVVFEFLQPMPSIDPAFCLPGMDQMVYPVPWQGPLNGSAMSFLVGTENMDMQQQTDFRDSHTVSNAWKM
ncbi:hypothetical protein ABOM_006768 [Aspergillus bombycis]|uniref:Xylanolytic transcriptional activator regulatory domain-containing protein n=1 Tax=Aspergillus bombycis TaxID=109264 RepID=A0A1F7ZYI9_9EURO|nr:hypothetical protein ABOM_006768 [Aspergillus bombycis]OGM44533.1 hypothetical protein ABOM_006768 [Aspergillus bombycis]